MSETFCLIEAKLGPIVLLLFIQTINENESSENLGDLGKIPKHLKQCKIKLSFFPCCNIVPEELYV